MVDLDKARSQMKDKLKHLLHLHKAKHHQHLVRILWELHSKTKNQRQHSAISQCKEYAKPMTRLRHLNRLISSRCHFPKQQEVVFTTRDFTTMQLPPPCLTKRIYNKSALQSSIEHLNRKIISKALNLQSMKKLRRKLNH